MIHPDLCILAPACTFPVMNSPEDAWPCSVAQLWVLRVLLVAPMAGCRCTSPATRRPGTEVPCGMVQGVSKGVGYGRGCSGAGGKRSFWGQCKRGGTAPAPGGLPHSPGHRGSPGRASCAWRPYSTARGMGPSAASNFPTSAANGNA